MRELTLAPEILEEYKKDFPSRELETRLKMLQIHWVLAPEIIQDLCEALGLNIEDVPVMLEYDDKWLQMEIDDEDEWMAMQEAWLEEDRLEDWLHSDVCENDCMIY